MHAELRGQLTLAQADPTAQPQDETAKAPLGVVVSRRHDDAPLNSQNQTVVTGGHREYAHQQCSCKQVVGETDDGGEVVRLAVHLRPNVVLIDLPLPTLHGITAARLIRTELPDTQEIVMTGIDAGAEAIVAIRAGAAAYLLNSVGSDAALDTPEILCGA